MPPRSPEKTFELLFLLLFLKYLVMLANSNQISMEKYQELRPTGSSRPRAYGLPKIHKNDVPLRPIMSMSGSAAYDISRWLARLLDPVVELFSSRCVKDSFEFVDKLKNADVPSNGIMCSYDVVSLFPNVPLDHTIEICRQTLYHHNDICPPTPHEDEFVEFAPESNIRRGIFIQ